VRSIELRWFCERDLSDSVLRGFDEHGGLEVRSDCYLLGTGEALGVKLRGGRLETKRRDHADAIAFEFRSRTIHGVVEHWRKSSEPPRDRAASERWIEVGKRRALRMLSHARVELTRLQLGPVEGLALRRPAIQCSLALEALPIAGALSLLRAELLELFADHAEIAELTAGWSGGYPAWLARSFELEQNGRRIAPP
jgi:hypothetical protein